MYASQGEIELDVTETIYFHPKFFVEFGGGEHRGRTTIQSEVFLTVKSGSIDSIKIIYPNITNLFEDLSQYPEIWEDFKGTWDVGTTEVPYTLSSTYNDGVFWEVLKRIPMEVKTVTFSRTLTPGMKVPLNFWIGSPNALDNRVTLDGSFVNFDISGPYNVVRTLESGLEGAVDTFKFNMAKDQADAEARGAFQAALDAANHLSSTLYSEVSCSSCCVKSWRFVLVFDPRLTGLTFDTSGVEDISKFGTPEDIYWPFGFPLYYRLNPLATEDPEVRSFVFIDDNECTSTQDPESAKFEISGTAQMSKPTMHLLTWAALILAVISILF